MKLIIDGISLRSQGVGIGVVAERLIRGLLNHRPGGWSVDVFMPREVAAPGWLAGRASIRSRTPVYTGHRLLDACIWQVGLNAALRGRLSESVFLSPGPMASWHPCQPSVVLQHDCIHRHFPAYQGRWWIRKKLLRLQELGAARATRIITESNHAAGDISQQLSIPRKKLSVIPAWLPAEYIAPVAAEESSRVRWKYSLPERFWLYVGGYDVRKNVDLLIDAYAKARRRTPCPPLVLAGRIPSGPRMPVCNVSGLVAGHKLGSPEVIRPGFIDNEDMPGLFAAAELFVYSSLYEGFGLPPLEAMGCGTPAITSNATSLTEVVTDDDYQFDPRSTEALTQLLVRAATSPLPLNPSFSRTKCSEAAAMSAYWDIFSALADTTRTRAGGEPINPCA